MTAWQKWQKQSACLRFLDEASEITRACFNGNVTAPAQRNKVWQVVSAGHGIWNDVVHIEAFPFSAKVGLRESAPLASVIVAFARSLCNLFPFTASTVVLRCAPLPRWMVLSANVRGLPRSIALFGAKDAPARSECLKFATTPLAYHCQEIVPTTPALARAVFQVSSSVSGAAHDTSRNWAGARRANLSAPFIAARAGTKPLCRTCRLKRDAADFAGLFHDLTVAQSEPQYYADIQRRMKLALAGPDERARAIVKASGKVATDHGPLFKPEPAE